MKEMPVEQRNCTCASCWFHQFISEAWRPFVSFL